MLGNKLLSDIVVYAKYAAHKSDLKRREVFSEIVDRSLDMHLGKVPKEMHHNLVEAFDLVREKKILPSMRSLQFGGEPMRRNEIRGYNCAYHPINHYKSFDETLYLLLMGTGVGWGVHRQHVYALPKITTPGSSKKHTIADSVEGWAYAVRSLMKSYLLGSYLPRFDYSDIRPRGAPLSFGGKAPGPEPLRLALEQVASILRSKQVGDSLQPIECHDILCHLADAVLAGGVRRSAAIALFDADDRDMLCAKTGHWWEDNPQRGRANNSAHILRSSARAVEDFNKVFEVVRNSGSGEPGIAWTNDPTFTVGLNPCGEASLQQNFCNLCTVNVANLESEEDYLHRVRAAALIGTVQASYTDFPFLRSVWKNNTERDALLGVSMTGIVGGKVLDYDIKKAAKLVLSTNEEFAKVLGINVAARSTLIKPEGTGSLVLYGYGAVSSGVHPYHSPYWIRRLRVGKDEPVYEHIAKAMPELVEDEFFNPEKQAVVSIPCKAPEGASAFRREHPEELLNRVAKIYDEWVVPGHRRGVNTHSVSCTVSVDESDWDDVQVWLRTNRTKYASISLLPTDGFNYKQMPFEEIDEVEYDRLINFVKPVKFDDIVEHDNNVVMESAVACAGGSCELTNI